MKGLNPHPTLSGEDTSPHNKVLIFSGNSDTRLLLKTFLELWGYNIEVSDCLENSVPVIQDQKPDLIIVDSALPFETHLESIRQIRKTEFLNEIPIIVLSGFSQPQFKNLSMACGADGFLVKPLDFDLLEKYLERYLIRHYRKSH
jgi:DNA-binding response OmpR family regulator